MFPFLGKSYRMYVNTRQLLLFLLITLSESLRLCLAPRIENNAFVRVKLDVSLSLCRSPTFVKWFKVGQWLMLYFLLLHRRY